MIKMQRERESERMDEGGERDERKIRIIKRTCRWETLACGQETHMPACAKRMFMKGKQE